MTQHPFRTSLFIAFATFSLTQVGCSFMGCVQYNVRQLAFNEESGKSAGIYDIGGDDPIGIRIKAMDRFADATQWREGDKVDSYGDKSTDGTGLSDPGRYKVPFLDLPGFVVAYEVFDDRKLPYYLHIYDIPASEMPFEKVQGTIQGQLQKEFENVDDSWPPPKMEDGEQLMQLREQTVDAPIFFDATSKGGEATKIPAKAAILAYKGDDRTVVFVARASKRAEPQNQLPWQDLYESLSRIQVDAAPEGGSDSEEGDAEPSGEDGA